MRKTHKPAQSTPDAGVETIPPGATKAAADRPIHRGGGAPGSGAARHATNDIGSPDETYEAVDSNDPLAEPGFIETEAPTRDRRIPVSQVVRWVERLRRAEAPEARSSIRFMSKLRIAATARSVVDLAQGGSRWSVAASRSDSLLFPCESGC